MSIGENIKKIRKGQGLTQKELAEKCSLSRSYLADLERNRYNPSLDSLQLIADSLGVNISALLDENKNSFSNKQPYDNLDLGSVKLNKIARYAKDLTESDQDTVLNVVEALRRAKLEDDRSHDRNDDTDKI